MKLARSSAFVFVAALGTLAIGAPARAEQFVLFSQTFEITKATVDKAGSHYFVRGAMLSQPPGNNWTAPVDYRNGNVYIRTEVLEKPAGGENNHWSYCYMPNRPIGPGYGCAGSGNYKEKGVYDRVEKMTSWWQNTAISWPQGIKEMHLVIKGMGDSGHLHKRTDLDKLYPSKVRITMVQVSAGATLDASKVPGMENFMMAGAPMPPNASPAADAGAADVAPTPPAGTGGSSGTGETFGTGGAPAGTGGSGMTAAGTGGTSAAGTGGAGSGGSAGGTGGGSAAPAPAGKPSDMASPTGTGEAPAVTGSAPLGCTIAGATAPGSAFAAFTLAVALLLTRRRARR